jgi:TolA-binding protein
METLYKRIIREYPDVPLAQESYWKLINIYVKDYSPPDYAKAEALFQEFLQKHERSPVRGLIEETLGKSYSKHAEWDRLLELCTYTYEAYASSGKRPRASLMYMYAEANHRIGNVSEAREGYKIVAELFPKLLVGRRALSNLENMQKDLN